MTITFRVIRSSFIELEAGIAYRFMAGSAKEMLWVPGSSQGREVASPDGLPTLFADWVW